MNKEALEKALAFPGIDERESAVYLAALEIKQPTALRVAQHTGISRPTVYRVLESLAQKGLMGRVNDGKHTVFVPENPKTIIYRLNLQATAVKNILPSLNDIYAIYRNRPKVRLLEGKEGMKRVCEDILATDTKELLAFSAVINLFKLLPTYWPAFVKKRKHQGIKARVIAPKSPESLERKRLGPRDMRQVRFIPKQFMRDFDGLTFIYADRVAFFSLRGDINAVIIEHRELAEIQRTLFEIAWAVSED